MSDTALLPPSRPFRRTASSLASSLATALAAALALAGPLAGPAAAQAKGPIQETLGVRGSWQPLGPLAGAGPHARELATVAVEPDHVYATSSAGLLRSTDRGATWSVHAPWPGEGFLPRLAVSPADPSRMVLLRTLQEIRFSSDGGATWSVPPGSPPGPSWWAAVFHPALPDVLHVGAKTGVFRTTDGGETFEQTLVVGASSLCRELLIDRNNGDRIYASAPYEGVYATEDGGDAWTLHPYPAGITYPLSHAIDPRDGRRILLGANGAFLSEDRGATWSQVVPAGTYVDSLAFDPLDPERLHAGFRGEGLATSDDGGTTWTVNPDPGLDRIGGAPATILPSLAHPGELLVSGFGGFARSLDDGVTFARANDGLEEHAYVASLVVDPFDADHLVAKTGGSAFTSFDAGTTWTEASFGHGFLGVELVADQATPGRFYVCGSGGLGGRLWRSDDGGLSYSAVWEDPVDYFFHLEPHPFLPGVVFGAGRGVQRSDDGGATWTSLGAPESWVWDVGVSGADPDRIVATAYDETLTSTDGGATWSTTPIAAPIPRSVETDPADPERAWFAAPGYGTDPAQGLYRTDDGGASWTGMSAEIVDASLVFLSPLHPGLLLTADSDRRRVQASFSGGASAFDLGGTLPSAALDLAATTAWIFAATSGHGVFALD